jgi:DNA-binding PadR family transcriptional regulator
MTRRKVANPLALAVLAGLEERAMHPYEMATTMRARHKDESIKLNFGSLYTVVEALQRHGLIEAQETEREGKRPERTVYRITAAGSAELLDWLSELISVPTKEYLRFEAGLSLLPVLSPTQAVELLEIRCQTLEVDLAQRRTVGGMIAEQGVPRLFTVELEYMTALVETELEWTRTLIGEVKSGSFESIELWQGFHATGPERGSST